MKDETKAKAAKIWDNVKAGLKTGFDATKKGLTKAGSAIQSYGDLGVVQIEKKQLESKKKKAFEALGALAFEKLSASGAVSFKADDQDVKPILDEITSINKDIAKRDKALKTAEKEGKIPGAGAKKAAAKKPAAKKTTKKAAEKKTE